MNMNGAEKSAAPRVLAMTGYRQEAHLQAALGQRWSLQRVAQTEEVLWRLRSGSFAALILHLGLSQKQKRETLEDVLRTRPETPVIVLVEPGEEALAAWALSRGASGYVQTGPALPILLEAVLENALHSAHLRNIQSRTLELEYREQLSALASAIRHEVNNPLTGILGSAEMALKSPDLPTPLRRRLSNIVKLTEEIRSLLQQLENVRQDPSGLLQLAQ